MNNIELQEIRKDTIKFFGTEVSQKIDKMNSDQLDKLKKKIDNIKMESYPSHLEIRAKKIARRKELERRRINGIDEFDSKISVVVPYMHTDERFPLLLSCLSCIQKKNVEICVVEIGKSRHLFLPPDDFEYMFVKYKGVMHRGWALNLGIRQLATGRRVVLLDADVILPDNFLNVIRDVNYPAVAWSKMFYLDKKNTGCFIEQKLVHGKRKLFPNFALEENCEKVKTPAFAFAAGGINIIPRDILMELKGVPEDFEGTWGGPDNAFMGKLQAYGYPFRTVNCDSIHLYHSRNTPRNNDIALKARTMMRWNKDRWSEHLDSIGNNWGVVSKDEHTMSDSNLPKYLSMNHLRKVATGAEEQITHEKEVVIEDLISLWTGLNRESINKVCDSEEPMVSLAMLSFMRTDIMLRMLDHWNDTRFIKSNIAFNVQGEERLDVNKKNIIRNNVETYFENSHLLFTGTNRGTGIPRYNMIHKALEFNTPYIMTTDDDMFFPLGSIEALISILEDHPDMGAVDMWVYPNLNAWFAKQEKMVYKQPKIPFGYVDGMGSATMVIRREVFETCDYDKHYYVGWADIDFCMQMKENNWKMGILALPNYKAFNFKGRGTKDYMEYKEHRNNISYAGNSSSRFFSKWGKTI